MRKWRPYGSRTDPGAWLSLANMFPTEAGTYRTANAFTTFGTAAAGPATPGTTLTAWFGRVVDGTAVGYVGTSTKLYRASVADFSAGTFTDASAAAYTASTWSFCQFGNITIAASLGNAVQSRDATGSSAFANLAGSPPVAKICVTQSNCVLLFNLTGAAHSFAVSDVGDHTNWSTGDAVASTPILHRAGPVTAAVAFQDYVLAFKSSSIYRLRYVGSPVYWTVELIADGIGAARMGSVCNCGSFVVFTGNQGAYLYDGASFRNIGDGFNSSGTHLLEDAGSDTSPAIYYRSSNHVLFKSDDNQGYYVYSINADAWGKFLPYASSDGSALTGFVPVGSDVGALEYPQGIGNGSVVIANLSANPCVRTDTEESSNTVAATLSTTLFGRQDGMTNFDRLYLQLDKTSGWSFTQPSATQLTVTPYTAESPSGSETTGTAASSSTNSLRFDINTTVRFARFDLALNYACEIADVAVRQKPAGTD